MAPQSRCHAAELDHYRRLADATMEGILIHDRGRIVEANRAASSMFQIPATALVGSSVLKLVAPESVAMIKHRIPSTTEEAYECMGLRADGTRFWMEVLSRPIEYESGLMRVVALRDVTARRRAEESAEFNEARYRQLIEHASDAIFVVDHAGIIREANPRACAMLGHSLDGMRGRQLSAFIDPDDLSRRPISPEHPEGVDSAYRERRMVRADGSGIDVEVSVSSLAGGLMLGVVRDVTERNRAAMLLRASEERYRELVERSPLPIGVHSGGQIVYMNPAALRLAGATHADQVVGKPMLSLVHPDYRGMVAARARHALDDRVGAPPAEEKFLRLDGQVLDVEVASMPIEFEGVPAVQVAMYDITERKRAEAQLVHQTLHDALTGLPNRTQLDVRLHDVLASGPAQAGPVAMLVIDLDHFKEVNDSLGHRFGDLALKEVADRWRPLLGDNDLLARMSGDEFAAVLRKTDVEAARQFGVKMQQALEQPFVIDGHRFGIGASVGIAMWPAHAANADTLKRHADMAMYAAKQRGSGCLVYEPEHDRHRPERLALVSDLREAIDAGQLTLHYQPQVEMGSGTVIGVEALVRWRDPRRGLVPPDDFIPLAEQAGLISRVTSWVLDTALEECSKWRAGGRELALSVNVSVRDLHDPAFPSVVECLLAKHQVPAEVLTIEITENSLMADVKRAGAVLCTLRRRGVRLSVDDFGTGYSSLAYLKGLPLDELKLDRSFIRELVDTSTDRAIVRATIALGHDLGLKVVAEGVEDAATIELLRSLGCDLVQGYAISRPLAWPELLPWLLNQSSARHDLAA